jgi:predicted O-linked N-acetylglucosamine transferase (SPINDLY family)
MSSSFDAAMLGVPLVTLPVDIPFGKWTASIYDYIGVTGLVAKDQTDYVEIAVRLANDPAWRMDLSRRIREGAGKFVESQASVASFTTFIDEAWKRHLRGEAPANWVDNAWTQTL